jgi:hypothetical protein
MGSQDREKDDLSEHIREISRKIRSEQEFKIIESLSNKL